MPLPRTLPGPIRDVQSVPREVIEGHWLFMLRSSESDCTCSDRPVAGRPPQVVDPRQLIGASIQDDVLDEKRKQLSLRTPVSAVWLQLATFAPGGRGQSHRLTAVTRTFSVEAKGLEPSNLLTASL